MEEAEGEEDSAGTEQCSRLMINVYHELMKTDIPAMFFYFWDNAAE